MWKITPSLSVFPAQRSTLIALLQIEFQENLGSSRFFPARHYFLCLALSDSDNVAFDKNPITYIW